MTPNIHAEHSEASYSKMIAPPLFSGEAGWGKIDVQTTLRYFTPSVSYVDISP